MEKCDDPQAGTATLLALLIAVSCEPAPWQRPRGALVAFSTKEGLPPYASRIQRGDASTGAWKTVF